LSCSASSVPAPTFSCRRLSSSSIGTATNKRRSTYPTDYDVRVRTVTSMKMKSNSYCAQRRSQESTKPGLASSSSSFSPSLPSSSSSWR
jgi:hypothetical protein